MHTILVIDDDESVRHFLTALFEDHNYLVNTASNGIEGLKKFTETNPFVVILDQVLPGMRGIDLLKKMKEYNPETNVIIITGYGEIKDAVKAMELGALNYLLKPLDATELRILVQQAQQNFKIRRERDFHREKMTVLAKGRITSIIFKSEAMKEVFSQCHKVARTDSTILLEGESGTGKGLFALYLHQISNRSDGPFIDIDCTTIPENLLESELFGYEPGAFTDAKKRKEGLIELAHQGTLFLDEISSLPLLLQGKLLKVLEQKSFRKLGGKKEIQVDVRIIVATNTNLLELTEKGLFRKDLYFRISTFPIRLPPLRDRKEDIIPIALHFFQEIKREYHKDIEGIEPEALESLVNYNWPGNVRELKNAIEKAIIIAQGKRIRPEDIHLETTNQTPQIIYKTSSYEQALAQFEKEMIDEALKHSKGNQTKAAQRLGVSRNFIIRLMKKHRINPFRYKD
ncbi:MAG: sigma-54-dependent transcriptional regulator [bacterium]